MVFFEKVPSVSIGLWKGKAQTATIYQQMYLKTSREYPILPTQWYLLSRRQLFGAPLLTLPQGTSEGYTCSEITCEVK